MIYLLSSRVEWKWVWALSVESVACLCPVSRSFNTLTSPCRHSSNIPGTRFVDSVDYLKLKVRFPSFLGWSGPMWRFCASFCFQVQIVPLLPLSRMLPRSKDRRSTLCIFRAASMYPICFIFVRLVSDLWRHNQLWPSTTRSSPTLSIVVSIECRNQMIKECWLECSTCYVPSLSFSGPFLMPFLPVFATFSYAKEFNRSFPSFSTSLNLKQFWRSGYLNLKPEGRPRL